MALHVASSITAIYGKTADEQGLPLARRNDLSRLACSKTPQDIVEQGQLQSLYIECPKTKMEMWVNADHLSREAGL